MQKLCRTLLGKNPVHAGKLIISGIISCYCVNQEEKSENLKLEKNLPTKRLEETEKKVFNQAFFQDFFSVIMP